MSGKGKYLLLAAMLLAGIVALTGTVMAYDTPLVLRGSTTVNPICQAVKTSWEAGSGNWALDIAASGTGDGLKPLMYLGNSLNTPSRVEIAMASRQPKSSEACSGQSGCTPGTNGYEINELDEWKIARDALVVVVPKQLYDAGVDEITREQLSDIYEGTLTNWSQLGGPSRTIVPRARELSSGTRGTLIDLLGTYGLTDAKEVVTIDATGLPRLTGNPDMVAAIAADNQTASPDEIAYVGIGFKDDNPTHVKALKTEGVVPSENTVYSNNAGVYPLYPLKRWLYLYTVKAGEVIGGSVDDPYSEQVSNFATFVRNDCSGQPIVKTEGFVKIYPDPDVNKDGSINTLDVGQIGLSWQASGIVCGTGSYRRDVDRNGSVNTLDVGKIGLMWQLTYDAP